MGVLVDSLRAHRAVRTVLTAFCLWSLGLDPWPYAYQVCAAFAYVPILCVYICTYLCVRVGVDASVPVCEFSIEGQRQLGALFLRSHLLCFFEIVFC